MPLSSEQKGRLKDPTTKVQFEQENPKSPGSKASQRYEQYKGSTTFHDATQNGARDGGSKRSKKDTPRRNTRP